MKTLAIVSSFNESCGNASFTKALRDSIQKYTDFKVEVIELDLKLLQSTAYEIRKQANLHIAEICTKLKMADAVNIQLESGLYGTLPADIVKRVAKLVKANPKTSVTLHSPRLIQTTNYTMRSGIKDLFSFRIVS
jgi:hypothetical protein